jgi:hypothetical protein
VHHEETIDVENFPDEFPHIISHFDEPFAGVTSPYFLSRLIGKHVKVALSGDGADELFGSYLSHRLSVPIYNYVLNIPCYYDGSTADTQGVYISTFTTGSNNYINIYTPTNTSTESK